MPNPQAANAIFAALYSLNPALPWLLLALAMEIGLRFARRLFPTQAKLIPAGWDLIPAALLAAGFAAATTEASSLTLFFGAVMGVLGPLLRTTPPTTPAPPPSPTVEATEQPPVSLLSAKRAATWTRGGPVALVLLVAVGCTQSRPPGRDPCYLAAETKAFQRGVTECADYESTNQCPAWPGIETDEQREQEACE